MDRFGDHALVCPCGGDRTKRHNHIRNHTFHFAASSGLNPELEKPGLLQPRPLLGSIPENGIVPPDPGARRPADVYLPRWRRGTPMALDFAVTSGMRDISASIRDAASATQRYEDFKRAHLDTEAACSSEGFGFTPMVIEAVGGGWGPAAEKILSELAKENSIRTGEPADRLEMQLYQGLSTILHRENSRAILKRLNGAASGSEAILNAATELQTPAGNAEP